MAITSVTAKTLAESAKSIQLTLDDAYTNETIKLEYSSTSGGSYTDVTNNYNISLVKDSFKEHVTASPAEYYYSLIVGKFDYYEEGGHNADVQALINEMLTPGYYKITIGTSTSSEVNLVALATSAASGTRTTLNTTFTKQVLLPSAADLNYDNILSLNGIDARAIKLTSVTRDNYNFVTGSNTDIKTQYTKLSLNIVPTNSNALPASNAISLSVGALPSNTDGALIDASRYLVPKTTVTASITAETPKILSATQNMTPATKDSTEIDVTFSQSMNISPTTGATSALDPNNYTLKINSVAEPDADLVQVIPDSSNAKFKLIYNSILTSATGQPVTLEIEKTVTNAMGDTFSATSMTDNVVNLTQLKDTTLPEVAAIIGLNKSPNSTGTTVTNEDNALIVKFKTAMATTGNNSAILSTNYKFIDSTAPISNVPLDANVNTVSGITPANSWILFTLDPANNYPVFEDTSASTSGNPNKNYDIHIGYTGLTSSDYRYVQNTVGNIYPLCDVKKIDATVPIINLAKGTVTIVDDKTLKYTYTDVSDVNNILYHNEFRRDTIIPANFEIYKLEEFNCSGVKTALTINSVTLDSTGTILTFTLPDNSLSSDTKNIYLTSKNAVASAVYDIFNKEVSGAFCDGVINNIPTSLDSLALIDITKEVSIDPNNPDIVGYPIEISASFATPIDITSSGDFVIGFKSASSTTSTYPTQNVAISSASILQVDDKNSNVVILKAYIPLTGSDFTQNKLVVRTSNEINYLRTKDFDNKTIQAFNYTDVESFNVSTATFKFNVEKDLNGASLSAKYNNNISTSSLPPEILTSNGLLVQNAKFTQQAIGSNFYYIDLSNTIPQLGYLVLAVKSPSDPIFMTSNNNTIFNVTITKSDTDTLTFEFSKSDSTTDLTLNMANVTYMQFIPSKYSLMGIDTNHYNVYANVSAGENANASIK